MSHFKPYFLSLGVIFITACNTHPNDWMHVPAHQIPPQIMDRVVSVLSLDEYQSFEFTQRRDNYYTQSLEYGRWHLHYEGGLDYSLQNAEYMGRITKFLLTPLSNEGQRYLAGIYLSLENSDEINDRKALLPTVSPQALHLWLRGPQSNYAPGLAYISALTQNYITTYFFGGLEAEDQIISLFNTLNQEVEFYSQEVMDAAQTGNIRVKVNTLYETQISPQQTPAYQFENGKAFEVSIY